MNFYTFWSLIFFTLTKFRALKNGKSSSFRTWFHVKYESQKNPYIPLPCVKNSVEFTNFYSQNFVKSILVLTKLISRNIWVRVKLPHCGKTKNLLSLISRNFCDKMLRVNLRNFHAVMSILWVMPILRIPWDQWLLCHLVFWLTTVSISLFKREQK